MHPGSLIALAAGGLLTVGAGIASVTGAGAEQPMKQPISVREGSIRTSPTRTGRAGTAYFAGRALSGGGLRGGK